MLDTITSFCESNKKLHMKVDTEGALRESC
jgi:hypothetical protein